MANGRSLSLIVVLALAGPTMPAVAAASTSQRGCSKRESAKLEKQKERAVLMGMGWLARALESDDNLRSLGTDAAAIFEGALTARSGTVRNLALPLARYQAARLLPISVQNPLADRWGLFEALWLLSEADNLRIQDDELLARVAKRLSLLPTAEALYAIDVDKLDEASESTVFGLLIDSWILEKALLVHPELPHPAYRLSDVLRFVFSRHYVTFDEDPDPRKTLFQDHAYLATHVAYVLSDFSRTKLAPEDLGPLYGYLRDLFEPAMRFGDPELISELVDVYRVLGFDERNDGMVCRGTRLLLSGQRDDGSWGDTDAKDAYDAIHPTWVIVDALRDRMFLAETPYSRFIKSIGPFTPVPAEPSR